MAPPSRGSLSIKAAKRLEEFGETLLELSADMETTLKSSKANGVYGGLTDVINTLTAVKDLCDSGKNTYPNYPAVREQMQKAGEEVYALKNEVSDVKSRCLVTDISNIEGWHEIGIQLTDIASRLRQISFVPERKKKEMPST